MYILTVYQVISWICIAISIKTAKTDVDLWGEEVE